MNILVTTGGITSTSRLRRLVVLTTLVLSFFFYASTASATVEVITTASTSPWTAPTNVYSVTVECWGGGGAGFGDGNGNSAGVPGGGGGGYGKSQISVTPSNTYAFSVGTGGAGASNGAGSPGGNTTFNTSSCIGIGGGAASETVVGTGGSGNTGDMSTSNGSDGSTWSGTTGGDGGIGGNNSDPLVGTGGTGATAGGNGGDASLYASGGGGSGDRSGGPETGGSGSAGVIRLTYFTGMTISGTLYSDQGQTAITSSKTINVRIGTSTASTHSTTTDGSGNWSIDIAPENIAQGTPYVVWVDGDASVRGTVVGKFNGAGPVSDIDIYQGHVIARHEGTGTTTTLTDFDTYDSSDDSDILYTVTPGASLTLLASSTLYIWDGDTFEANAAVTIPGSLTGGTSATYIGSSTAALTFTGTSTGLTVGPLTFRALGDITFNGSGGEWAIVSNITVADFAITTGSVVLQGGSHVLRGAFTNNGTFTNTNGSLRIGGDYTNNGTYTNTNGLITFYGASASISGSSIPALGDVTVRGNGKVFSANASTSNLTIPEFTYADGTVFTSTKIADGENGGPIGLEASDYFGSAIANIGDLNGDGVTDLAVGAYADEATAGNSSEGAVHILFMNSDGTVASTVKISDNENGGPIGLDSGDNFGAAIANIGDLNGDGVVDLAVGAYGDEATAGDLGEGAVHILFMNSDGTATSTVKISDNENGGPIGLDASDNFGSAVANIGDLNGDGVVDLAVGATGDEATGGDATEGALFILFMNSDGTVASTVKIADGENGGPIGLDSIDRFGAAVATIGDLNGDGVTDLAVGARQDESTGGDASEGAVHILFMNSDGTVASTVKISDNENGGPTGLNSLDSFGFSVANIGDLNGDGVVDLAVGAYADEATAGNASEGAVHILFMNSDGTVASTVKIADGENGGPSVEASDYFGFSVATIGDLNGDGVIDLAVGATGDEATAGDASEGALHILFLTASSAPNMTAPSALTIAGDFTQNGTFDANNGTLYIEDSVGTRRQTLTGTLTGTSSLSNVVFSARTVINNATKINDFTVTNNEVVIGDGTASGTVGSVKIANNENGGPTSIDGGDRFGGSSVTTIGDLNGDGVTDLAVGAHGDQATTAGNASEGAVHILFMNSDGTVSSSTKISDNENGGPIGLDASDGFGYALDNIGDLNGDGVTDLAVGAFQDEATVSGASSQGAVHILFMNSDGTVSSSTKISSNENGGPAIQTSDRFGSAVANIGDLNGDGVTDLAVGAYNDETDAGDAGEGAVHILFMNSNGTVSTSTRISDNENGGPIGLDASDNFGWSVTNIGDLNGDGVTDLAVGAYQDESTSGDAGEGAVHILFMNSDGTVASTVKIADNENGGPVGINGFDYFGSATANIGDLNGDGVTDLAVGALGDEATSGGASSQGALHILFMNSNGTVASTVKISDNENGGPIGLDASDNFGSAIANIGDLNGDGVTDLAVGAYADEATSGGVDFEGALHILFMTSATTTPAVFPDSSLTITGDYTNNGLVEHPIITKFVGASAQALAGTMTGSSGFQNVQFTGAGTKTFTANASTTDFTVLSDSGVVSLSSTSMTISGNYLNLSTTTGNTGTIYFTESGYVAGTLTGSSSLGNVLITGGREFLHTASTSDLKILSNVYVYGDGTVSTTTKIADGENGGPSVEASDNFGISVANIGDLNGDGVVDLAVGAHYDEATGGDADEGALFILFMNSDGTVASSVKIADGENGGPVGLDAGDHFGSSVANIGDLNGDGTVDLAVGAHYDEATGGDASEGAIFILFMNSNGTVASSVKIADGENGGPSVEASDFFGISVANIGDVNSDGIVDLAAGATGDEATSGDASEGALFILFMNSDGTVASSVKIADGENGGPVGLDASDRFGSSVTTAGDLNGDGVVDIAVGAWFDEATAGDADEGAIFILFMNSNGTVASSVKIADGENGGPSVEGLDRFGSAVTNIGDLNGDGIVDLAVGTTGDEATAGDAGEGALHILFMNSNGTVASSVKIADGENGGPTGLDASDNFGFSVATIGDLNGDGVVDLAVGAYLDEATGGDSAEGSLHIHFMSSTTATSTLKAPDLLTIQGDYTNNGVVNFVDTGTTTFNGTSLQTATGTMTGDSELNNVLITNTSGTDASSSPSVIFGTTASSTGNLTIETAGVMVQFANGATTTWQNMNLAGTGADYVYMYSDHGDIQYNINVIGTTSADYVYFKDANACASLSGNIETTNSVDSGGNNTCINDLASAGGGDTSAPTPDPTNFATAPSPTGTSTITMTATAVTDPSTPVEYYFTATTSSCGANIGTGGTDSGWQTSTSYTDTGLETNQCYGYTVTARDSAGNYTATSTASTTYTHASVPGVLTYSSVSTSSLIITNDENGNPATDPTTSFAVYATSTDTNWDQTYVTAAGATSTSPVWLTDTQIDNLSLTELQPSTLYDFEVIARNEDGVVTASSTLTGTTTTAEASASDPTISSAANQTFTQGDATTTISTITITDSDTATITTTNDIRIAIASTSVAMKWDTDDTTAVLDGTASTSVSTTVSYSGDGTVLILDVTTNFSDSDTLIISGLSYAQFTATNTAAAALTLHLDGAADATPVATDDKTVTIEEAISEVVWDGGGGNSNWETAANWSTDTVPGATNDVVIETAVTVVLNGATTIQSLTVGSSTSAVASVLSFNYDAVSNPLVVSGGDVTIYNGANITHTNNVSVQSYAIGLDVTGDFTLNAGGTIDLDYRGYEGNTQANGYGPGNGVYVGSGDGGTGGAYGGDGGDTSSSGGAAYGSTTNPVQLGSGGGGGYTAHSGDGGGLIILTVTGTTTINGTLTADGESGGSGSSWSAGGGSGGGINITTGGFAGTGSIGTNGGAAGSAGNDGGSGSGGRIAIKYSTGTTSNLSALTSYSGTVTEGGVKVGGAGTIYVSSATQANGNLIIKNNDYTTGSYGVVIGVTTLDALTVTNSGRVRFDDVTTVSTTAINTGGLVSIDNNTTSELTDITLNAASLLVNSGSTLDYTTLNGWGDGGVIYDRGTINFPASLTVPSGGTYVADGAHTYNNLTVNGNLTHTENTNAKTYYIDLTVTGDFTLNTGGTINLDARGYAGRYRAAGYGPGAGGYTGSSGGGSGGAYGGDGGDGESASSGGAAYGSTTNPVQLGSAGGAGYTPYGGDGGGLVILNVSGTTTIDGIITADGATAGGGTYAGGGGAGGGINITTGVLAGTGSIGAIGGSGGSAGRAGGAGGGGRIALVYSTGTTSGLTLQAYGGTAVADGKAGAAGTIYTKSGSQTHGDLSVNNNGITTTNSYTPLAGAATSLSLNDLTVASLVQATTPSTLTLAGDYTNSGTVTHSGTVIFAGVTQQTATGTMTSTSQFNNLSITNTSQNGTTSQSVVFGAPVTVAGTMTMVASTSAAFAANATSSFNSIDWLGGLGAPVWLRSSTPGTQWYLDIPGSQLNVDYVDVQDSNATSTSGGVTANYSTDASNNINWTFTEPPIGSSTISDHDATQVSNGFNFMNKTNEPLFAFKFTPNSGDMTITNIVFDLTGISRVVDTDFSNIRLYRDLDNDALYDATDTQVGGAGSMTISGASGDITFTGDFLATTSQNYLVIADWNYPDNGSYMTMHLNPEDITVTDTNGAVTVDGSVDTIQHRRNNRGGGSGGISNVGAVGNGVVTGGTNDGGEELGGEPNFEVPTGTGDPHTEWTGGANAYISDGSYASETTNNERQSYDTLGYSIPGSNQIDGIAVKLEASALVGTGTIEVVLSWDGGTSVTAAKVTAELTGTDTVYTLGGSSDTWGRTWSPSDFSDANFRVRLIGQPSAGGTVQVDAVSVRVYNSTSGGGSGGGGGEI